MPHSSSCQAMTTIFDPAGIRIICSCGIPTPYCNDYDEAVTAHKRHQNAAPLD